MRAIRIARLDLLRLRRSRGLWMLAFVLTAGVSLGVTVPATTATAETPATGLAFLLGPGLELLLPIVIAVGTAGSIARQREAGRLPALLSAPYRREDLLFGVLLARTVGGLAMTGVALLSAGIAILVLYGIPPVAEMALFTGLTLAAVVTFVFVGTGLSAAVRSPTAALATLLMGILFAHAFWDPLIGVVVRATPLSSASVWEPWLRQADPMSAYVVAADAVLPASPHIEITVDSDGMTSESQAPSNSGEATRSELLRALAIFSAWASASLVIARRRIRSLPVG